MSILQNTEMRLLPVVLTPDEIALKGKELARASEDERACDAAETRHKEDSASTAKALKTATAGARGRRLQLSHEVTTGRADRDVRCTWHVDIDGGEKFLVREDTGEAIARRALEQTERQLFIGQQLDGARPEQLQLWRRQIEKNDPAADVDPDAADESDAGGEAP